MAVQPAVATTGTVSYKEYTFDQLKTEILTRVNDPDGDTYSSRANELIYEGICAMVLGDYPRDGYPGLAITESVLPNSLSTAYRIKVSGAGRETDYPLLKVIAITDDYIAGDDTGTGINEHRFIPINIEQYNRLNDANERPFEDEVYYYRQGDFLYFYPGDMTLGKLLVTYIGSPESYSGNDVMNNKFSLDFLYKVVDYTVAKIREQQAGE